MANPDFQSLMLPMLKLIGDGQSHALKDIRLAIIKQFNLTEEDLQAKIPSGHQSVINNRVGWARTHLKGAGLLYLPQKGYIQITEAGQNVLKNPPEKITIKYLMQFPGFAEFRSGDTKAPKTEHHESEIIEQIETPDELLGIGYEKVRKSLEYEILDKVKSCSPHFFEILVVDLLVKMGYGGSQEDAGKAIGKTGDEGIDGVIKEDKLGLDLIYLQAKKWNDKSVDRTEIQQFVGALHGKKARKGVFITTSKYTKGAIEYANNIENKVILIDGPQLAGLMIDYNVGVSVEKVYEIKRMDLDYFPEE